MAFYNDIILPRLCDLAMRNKRLVPYRERVIGAAEGRVLEVGAGSGRNLPFYGPSARQILALEPSSQLVAMARGVPHHAIPVTFLEASAEGIPLDDGTIDTVVTTWTLCSIPQGNVALGGPTYSNANIRFQSFFMSTPVHLFTAAASSATSSLPKCEWRS